MATEFTPQQIAILQAAFDHVWARIAAVREDTNEDSARIATLLAMLVERGILTAEGFEAALEELTATVGIESGLESLANPRPSDREITREILRGDVGAFTRRAEEDDDQ